MTTTFRVDAVRERKGMSMYGLAKRSGVSYATVRRVCLNLTETVALGTLDKLAAALGCKAGNLLVTNPTKRKR